MRALKPRTVYAPWIGEHPLGCPMLAKGVRLGLEHTQALSRGPLGVRSPADKPGGG